MLVNGKVWPFLEVEPRLYRFRILNGCNARILNLDIGGARMWQIGAEGGMWDEPVPVTQLVLAPSERADVLFDFSQILARTTHIKNSKPPSPVSNPAPPLAAVMQIRVGNTTPVPPSIPTTLEGGRKADLHDPVTTRYITLNEIDVDEPTWFLNLNGVHFEAPVTEAPAVGTVEDWVYVNVTGDTHPMHTHLVTFQSWAGRRSTRRRTRRRTRARMASRAGSTRPRSRRARWSRPILTSAASRTRSRLTPASSPPSGPSSTCRRG
jgi:spore coat protein A, manganese oxidase